MTRSFANLAEVRKFSSQSVDPAFGRADRTHGTQSIAIVALALVGCAAPRPYVDLPAIGKAQGEVSRLVSASEARLFPCLLKEITGDRTLTLSAPTGDVTLAPGRYELVLKCSSGHHWFEPKAAVLARPGKTYRITGFLVDDSITIFTMRMRARVEELPS